jgi:hypothetical protein
MLVEDIHSITNLNATAPVIRNSVQVKILFLCTTLLRYLCLSNGHQLIAEIHQAAGEAMGAAQGVVPDTPEAKRMIGMLNRNFPAYVGNVLKDQDLPEDFLQELLRKSCCQLLVSEINHCKWDAKTGTITTLSKLKQDKSALDPQTTSWYRDAFADLALNEGNKKKLAPPPESLFNCLDLDGTCSIGTIHKHHMRAKQPGSPPPRTRGKQGLANIHSVNSDEDSASLSSSKGSHSETTDGVEDSSPTSSAEAGESNNVTVGG